MDIILCSSHTSLNQSPRPRGSSSHYIPVITSPFKSPQDVRCFRFSAQLSRVIILDPPLAIRVHEASTAAVALGAAAAAYTTSSVSAQGATETEQDRCDEETRERGPGKAHQVATNRGLKAGGAEGVAAFDNPGAVLC